MDCVTASFALADFFIDSILNESTEHLSLALIDLETEINFGRVNFKSEFKIDPKNQFQSSSDGFQKSFNDRKRAVVLSRQPSASVESKSPKKSKSSVPVHSNLSPVIKTQGAVIFGKDANGNLICPICNKSFTAQASADRHFTNVHNKISFKCEMCDYACRKDYLKVHAMKHHGVNENMAKLMVQNCKQVQQ